MMRRLFFGWCAMAILVGVAAGEEATVNKIDLKKTLYVYQLPPPGKISSYDEAMAVACLQGIINREGPCIYVLSSTNPRPRYWLDLLSNENQWLVGKNRVEISGLDALVKLATGRVKGAVIWDPEAPATINIATTIAGVRDGVVLSPELAAECLSKWNLPVLEDLRGRFTGTESGSKKNDAYRWAVREYLDKGLCSSHFLCLFEDACSMRAAGDVGYVVTRDWAVFNRSFVFDLSPWGDEIPKDDPNQSLGTDLETYKMILNAVLKQSGGKHMTEMTGFFAFWKYSNMPGFSSKHEPVPTEWETVYLISPYNCYQNTISSECYNQSLHSQAPFKRLKQSRPEPRKTVEEKAYLCFLMADYDSATPLYEFLPKHWEDPNRGKIPLAWGINPNLIETYPDLITHFYATVTPNDHFTSDASAAGYFNPNRVQPQYLPLFTKHNKHFFRVTDMSMAPMVLDWNEPTPAVKDAFADFAPDGFATIVLDMHGNGGTVPKPHVWKGMPVTELINNTCNYSSPKQTSDAIYGAIMERGNTKPGFYFFRIVWVSPSTVMDSLDVFRSEHPEIPIEVVDPYNFFRLFKLHDQHKEH
ncbi:MAG TPA: GxGYxYP family putative glycoside hydrolase [Candidatus Hydrogenedentes bacterium]|nr:GxGYxYP family putative glycoside hydrolase [Candidatus Hydrogenedentota bacterium]